MNPTISYRKILRDMGPIIVRHVFLFVNAIIFAVVIFLFVFGDKEAALFLGAIIVFNMCLGIIQDTRARIVLEKIQMLTAFKFTRINADETETTVYVDEIKRGDRINIQLGDQVPCDARILSAAGLEVSGALITGESDSFARKEGEMVNAGDIVTAGVAVIQAQVIFKDSRISKMTEAAKKYAATPSPIERAINTVITYTGYILFVVLVFVVVHGIRVHESHIEIVLNAGALASIIVPQGLLVIVTLLFAFGASSYSSKRVLFQETNATEKLGRIKNLCMDKTGTLTGNNLIVEELYTPTGVSKEAAAIAASLYIHESGDTSQTINAVKAYLKGQKTSAQEIIQALPFSSWRQYGAVALRGNQGNETILVGSADVFAPHLKNADEKKWLSGIVEAHAYKGKRLLCVAESNVADISKGIEGTALSVLGVFVFGTDFREGIEDAIAFFQNRGVRIRIISGDAPETVRAIAAHVGVVNTDTVITGSEMQSWSDADYDAHVADYTIFARIVPEQKVKIIEAFKKDGFTAMVGDGANDALAIKKSDLGIAMFDGAPATRQLAAVVLMNNSFTDLPGGVELADNFIRNIEIFAGIFINQSLLGLFFFIILSVLGYTYPITPLNVTVINYFAVGLPGVLIAYWAVRPSGKVHSATTESFLSQVLPFVVWCAIVQSIAVAFVFILSPEYLKMAQSDTLVLVSFIVSGFIFFALAPSVYRGEIKARERLDLLGLLVVEIALFFILIQIPFFVYFFNITKPFPSVVSVLQTLGIMALCGVVQYIIMRYFFTKTKWYKKIQ